MNVNVAEDERAKDPLGIDKKVTEHQQIETVIKVASAAVSEYKDRRAVRCRSRRERPRKLRPLTLQEDAGSTAAKYPRFDAIEPDIESFVSSCLPGVSLTQSNAPLRSKMVRKRSLPSMSFLSSTTYAAAEKKRRKEEQARQKLLAEEAAKKIMDSTMQLDSESKGDAITAEADMASNKKAAAAKDSGSKLQSNADEGVPTGHTTTTTITFEGQSNILMPPLLVNFMNNLRKHKH